MKNDWDLVYFFTQEGNRFLENLAKQNREKPSEVYRMKTLKNYCRGNNLDVDYVLDEGGKWWGEDILDNSFEEKDDFYGIYPTVDIPFSISAKELPNFLEFLGSNEQEFKQFCIDYGFYEEKKEEAYSDDDILNSIDENFTYYQVMNEDKLPSIIRMKDMDMDIDPHFINLIEQGLVGSHFDGEKERRGFKSNYDFTTSELPFISVKSKDLLDFKLYLIEENTSLKHYIDWAESKNLI